MGFVSTCKYCGNQDEEGGGNIYGICYDCSHLKENDLPQIMQEIHKRTNLNEIKSLKSYVTKKIKENHIISLSKELNENSLFFETISFINAIKGKSNQTSPEQFAELFIKIMQYGGISNYDIQRYLKHIEVEFNKLSND